MIAAPLRNKSFMKMLLLGKADPDLQMQSTGQSALMICAQNDDVEGARTLLEGGANASVMDHDGNTALMIASRSGFQALTHLLAVAGNPDICNSRMRTALHQAAENGKEKCVWTLLEDNADPMLLDMEGKSPILLAVERNYYGTVSQLIGSILARFKLVGTVHPLDVADIHGFSPLIVAARDGHAQIAELLLLSKASVHLRDNDGLTALAHAAKGDRHFLLSRLLENGAAVDSLDKQGLSPLHHALRNGNAVCVLELLHKNANPMSPDPDGVAPMVLTFLRKSHFSQLFFLFADLCCEAGKHRVRGRADIWRLERHR